MTLAAQIADPAAPLNEYGALRRVMICPAEAAYGDQRRLDTVWQGEEFLGRPDFAEARKEYDAFAQILADSGAEIDVYADAADLGQDDVPGVALELGFGEVHWPGLSAGTPCRSSRTRRLRARSPAGRRPPPRRCG